MLAQLGILAAIMLVFHFTGIGYIKLGAIEMTIMMVPVIIGAITLGPIAGAILGGIFGVTVCLLPFTQSFFMAMNLPGTIIMCVAFRGIILGFLIGLLFKGFNRLDSSRIWSCEATGLIASLLNTAIFVVGAVIIYGNNPMMHDFFESIGMQAKTPSAVFSALIVVVGVQAVVEAAICTLVASVIAKAVMTYLQKSN